MVLTLVTMVRMMVVMVTLVVMLVMMEMVMEMVIMVSLKLFLFDANNCFRYGFLNENFREPLRVNTTYFKTVSYDKKKTV